MRDVEVTEQQILTMFEENFQRLKLENGHSLSAGVKDAAKQQILLYWKKLKDVARSVTDTEVSLNLPNQETPKGRRYNIEGIVDVVREGRKITMYDIKTHEANFVRSHIEMYQPQLNVYAYIWKHLKSEEVSDIAVIATRPPIEISSVLFSGSPESIEEKLLTWDPIIKMALKSGTVNDTIHDFSNIVDQIEEHLFGPPDQDTLSEKQHTGNTFATDVCRNCDARFSCASYRMYASKHKTQSWSKFADFYDMEPEEVESDEQVEANIESEDHLDDIVRDLS